MAYRFSSRARSIGAVALLLAALVALPGSAFASRTLALSAGTFKFNVSAGSQASGQVVVMNEGTEPLKVMVYASDQSVDPKGVVTYTAPTRANLASLDQPSAWTTIKMPANSKSIGNIPYLDLAPGQRVPIKFSFVVPPNVTPGDHNVVIFFDSFEPPTPGQSTQSIISGRLGSRVTLRVNGPLLNKLEVRPFIVPAWVIGNQVPWDFTVRNIGNTDQRVGARVLLLDRVESEVARQTAIDGLTVFAGTNYEATGTISAPGPLAVGPYEVRVDVSPVDETGHATNAGADTLTERHTVWLVPLWLIIAAVVLLVVVIAVITWAIVARSRERKRRMADEAYQRGLGDATRNQAEWSDEHEA